MDFLNIEDHILNIADIFETISDPVESKHWFMSAEYHAREFIFVNLFYLLLVFIGYVIVLRRGSNEQKRGIPKHSFIPKILALVLLINLALNIYYKPNKPFGNRNYFYMLQPCHIVSAVYSFCLLTNNVIYGTRVFNVSVYYVFVTIAALVFPDLTDLTQPGEVTNFFVQHYALLIAPVVIHMYKFPVSFNIGYALMSTGFCGLAHHVVFEICSLISGININYMLYPPPVGFDLNEVITELSGGRATSNIYRLIIGPLLNFISWPLGAIAIATGNFIAFSLYGIRLEENIKQKVN